MRVTSRPAGVSFAAPAMHELRTSLFVGLELLQRLTGYARNHRGDEPLDWLISTTTINVLS